jgi:hypothetical protein
VERERTPEYAIQVGIYLHLAGLSLSNTKQHLGSLCVDRSRTAIHNQYLTKPVSGNVCLLENVPNTQQADDEIHEDQLLNFSSTVLLNPPTAAG